MLDPPSLSDSYIYSFLECYYSFHGHTGYGCIRLYLMSKSYLSIRGYNDKYNYREYLYTNHDHGNR